MAAKVSVTVVGGKDRQLEARLRATGLPTTGVRTEDLVDLAHPSSSPSEVIVLDLRGPDVPSLPAGLAPLKRHHPSTTVIIVTETLEAKLILEAMRSGVSECVTDLTGDHLEASIARLVAERAAPEVGDVFAFVGAKGGVGTTTVAVNIATALAKVSSTLLIDLHLAGGDAALFFGVSPRFSINDTLENTHRLDAAFFRGLVTRTKAGPDLLASADRPVSVATDPDRIRSLIDFAARHYRFTVLDLSRFDSSALDALEAATAIVIVATQELSAVRSAARLVTMLRGRYGKEKVSVLVGRDDREAEITISDVERAVGGHILTALPDDYRSALDALNRGTPLVTDTHSVFAGAFETCARQLARLRVEDIVGSTKSGFLGRLAGRK